jgi:hypothetical protein
MARPPHPPTPLHPHLGSRSRLPRDLREVFPETSPGARAHTFPEASPQDSPRPPGVSPRSQATRAPGGSRARGSGGDGGGGGGGGGCSRSGCWAAPTVRTARAAPAAPGPDLAPHPLPRSRGCRCRLRLRPPPTRPYPSRHGGARLAGAGVAAPRRGLVPLGRPPGGRGQDPSPAPTLAVPPLPARPAWIQSPTAPACITAP